MLTPDTRHRLANVAALAIPLGDASTLHGRYEDANFTTFAAESAPGEVAILLTTVRKKFPTEQAPLLPIQASALLAAEDLINVVAQLAAAILDADNLATQHGHIRDELAAEAEVA